MRPTYVFTEESSDDLAEVSISKLADADLQENVDALNKSIVNTIETSYEDPRAALNKRGFVVTISGAWGTGKTRISHALINSLDDHNNIEIIRLEKELLPFGNINESMSLFLNSFSEALLDKAGVNVRSQIKQFALEATPTLEPINLSANMGFFSISRSMSSNTKNPDNADRMKQKMQKLAKTKRVVLILIDDLDRLKPEEVTPVLRLVERLRQLPRVFIILPLYKKIINNAIEKDLQITSADAETFLRKITDVNMIVNNSLESLKDLFLKTINHAIGDSPTAIFGRNPADLYWLMLLHVIVSETAATYLESSDDSITPFSVLNTGYSEYLTSLNRFLSVTIYTSDDIKDTSAPYPVYIPATRNTNARWARLSEAGYMKDFASVTSKPSFQNSLENMTNNIETIASIVTAESSIVSAIRRSGARIGFDPEVEKKDGVSIPIFLEVMAPLLEKTTHEAPLTDNYTKRDIVSIARSVYRRVAMDKIDMERTETQLWSVFSMVRDGFRDFRDE